MNLTKLERLNLINQFLILEKLYPEDSDYYAKHRKALQEGYTLHYKWIFEHLYDELSEEECKEVLNILEMYRAIAWSYMQNTGKSEVDERRYQFAGFDGNNETSQLSYTSYFIIELDRFQELLYGKEYNDFNSHMPMLEKYRRMLAVWQGFGSQNKMSLSKDQIENVLEA
ncbi:YfbU family protein [Stutzerimonas nitrititolerans]|jgi:uncharacterized protein YfbU (UPF0304 family)|uniref:YfbU family protein n=1 Tax=Stutzerimonas nitrititolerans TaxID=2482751 RepID=UPI0020204909|nr:YfbU family protein [Stutzerimonas nitrititolerans]